MSQNKKRDLERAGYCTMLSVTNIYSDICFDSYFDKNICRHPFVCCVFSFLFLYPAMRASLHFRGTGINLFYYPPAPFYHNEDINDNGS